MCTNTYVNAYKAFSIRRCNNAIVSTTIKIIVIINKTTYKVMENELAVGIAAAAAADTGVGGGDVSGTVVVFIVINIPYKRSRFIFALFDYTIGAVGVAAIATQRTITNFPLAKE